MAKPSNRPAANARQERIRQAQRQEQRGRRIRNLLIIGAAVIVVAAVVAVTVWGISRQQAEQNTIAGGRLAPAKDDLGIEGLQSAEVTDRDHVTTTIDYPENPPIGGNHHPSWQNCGFYSEPIGDEHGVHSLEHGAVWISYAPDLPDDQVQQLRSLAPEGDYVLVSPRPGLENGIVATAWGYQVALPDPSDPRLQQFLDHFVQGPQTLENASCSGATGDPE